MFSTLVVAEGWKKLVILIAVGVLVRVVLLLGTDWINQLSSRVELVNFSLGLKYIYDTAFLWRAGVKVFDYNTGTAAPIIVAVCDMIRILKLETVFLISLDSIVALYLYKLAKIKFPIGEDDIPLICSASYLFNPLVILSTTGKSISGLTHLLLVGSFYHTLKRNVPLGLLFASGAAYIGMYPIMILPPLLMLARKQNVPVIRSLFMFTGFISLFLGLSYLITGRSWSFLISTYGSKLMFKSLRPNVGLYWYLFIEIFDFFRPLFTAFLQLHIFFYSLPVAVRFRNHPIFMAFLIISLISILQGYPTASDAALYMSMLPLFPELLKHCKFVYPALVAMCFTIVMAPVNWYFWVHQGSGNANFYYATTLVYNCANVFIIGDMLRTFVWRSVLDKNPTLKETDLYQK